MKLLLASALAAAVAGTGVMAASDWTLYRASIAAADASLRLHETSSAMAWLDAAPPRERGWEWRYLRALADQSRRVVRAHDAPITGVTVSADGRTIATTSGDATVRLWDAETGAAHRTLTGAKGTTWSPAFRNTTSHVAALSSDGTLRVWDMQTADAAAAPVAAFEAIGRGLGATAWSPDGSLLAAATWTVEAGRGVRGWVHLWHFDERRLLWKANYGVKPIASLAFSREGSQLAVGTWDGRVGLFAVPGDGAPAFDLAIGAVDDGYTAVQSVAYAGNELIVGTKDGLARTYSTHDGTLSRTYTGHGRWVNGVAVSRAGWYVTASSDETIRIWDRTEKRPRRILHGHRAAVLAVAMRPGDGGIVSGDADGMLRWWDASLAEVEKEVWQLSEASVFGVDFTRDGRLAATASWGGAVTLRDAATGNVAWGSGPHPQSANAVAFSPDGTRVVSAGNEGRLVVSPVDGGTRLASWEAVPGRQVASVAWSPDGRLVLSPSAAPNATLWDAATGTAVRTIAGRGGSVTAVAFSPDGRFAAAAASNGDVMLARVDSGETAVASGAHPGGAHAVAFDPTSGVLATGGADRKIRLWRAPGLVAVRELSGHAEQVTGLSFSPDGRRLASSSNNQSVRLWQPSTGEPLLMIPFAAQVYGLRFSPDGRRLAVLPLDGTVRLLEAPAYH